jgi:hypothetical protein
VNSASNSPRARSAAAGPAGRGDLRKPCGDRAPVNVGQRQRVQRFPVIQKISLGLGVGPRPQARLLPDEIAPDRGRERVAGPRSGFGSLGLGIASEAHRREQFGGLGAGLIDLEDRGRPERQATLLGADPVADDELAAAALPQANAEAWQGVVKKIASALPGGRARVATVRWVSFMGEPFGEIGKRVGNRGCVFVQLLAPALRGKYRSSRQ